VAAETRAKLIELGHSFIAEVFAHSSKLDLITSAHAADYTVALQVQMVPAELSVERMRPRVQAGGHTVPEDKIRERHRRPWPLVATTIALFDSATVYDDTRLRLPRIVAQLNGGPIVGAPQWPAWAPSPLTSRWPR
jgi:predicted ABC-type ATPase